MTRCVSEVLAPPFYCRGWPHHPSPKSCEVLVAQGAFSRNDSNEAAPRISPWDCSGHP